MTEERIIRFTAAFLVLGALAAIVATAKVIAEPIATDPKVFVREPCPPGVAGSALLEREVRALESIARNLENTVYKVKEQ